MEQIEEVKQKTDIVQIVGERVELKKAGRYFKGLCPFHGEKTPSFVVSPELQIFKCFGCGAGGDVISFLQEFEKMTFPEALATLADKAGVILKKSFKGADPKKQRLLQINHDLARFYAAYLKKHPKGEVARAYLKERGVTVKTIEEFSLGMAPAESGLTARYLKKERGYDEGDLIATGSFGKGSWGKKELYDRFRERVIFPLFDHRGQVLGFSGRVLPGSQKEQGKYINSPETELYHKGRHVFGLWQSREGIKKKGGVVVVEGELDFLSLWQAGIKNVVAIKGTAFTREQLELLGRFGKNLSLFLDSDAAGGRATMQSLSLAEELGMEVGIVEMKGYKDPDEAMRAEPKLVKKRIESPLPVGDWLIKTATKGSQINTAAGQKRVMRMVLPWLSRQENAAVAEKYGKKLASSLGVSPLVIEEELEKLRGEGESLKTEAQGGEIEKESQVEKYLLELVIMGKGKKIDWKEVLGLLRSRRLKRLGEELEKLKSVKKVTGILEKLPAELGPLYEELYLKAGEQVEESWEKEFEKTVKRLKELRVRAKIQEAVRIISRAEGESNKKEIKEWQEKMGKWSSELLSLKR